MAEVFMKQAKMDTFLMVAQEGTEARKETEALTFWQHSANCLP